MFSQFRFFGFFLFAVALFVFAGCSNPEEKDLVIVKGKLLDNGKPFVFDESKIQLPKGASAPPPGSGGGLRIVFINAETLEQFLAAFNAETSTFEIRGPTGKGIKSGKYKVTLTANYSPVSKDSDVGDYFGGQFMNLKTQIFRQVKDGEEITIDVAKQKG